MADIVYRADLDTKQVMQKLDEINKSVTRLANEADKNFQRAGKSLEGMGIKIGVTSGLVGALTQEIIQLGSRAVSAISEVISSSTELSGEFETTEKTFTGIFEGSEKIALAALGRIRESSKLLGADLTGLGKSFLPFVGSLDEFERLSKAAIALGRAQPEQGQAGAIISLREALSGDVTSLIKRFEVPRQFANQIKKAFETGGTTAFIEELDKVLARLGISFDQTADTLQASIGRVEQQTVGLKLALGEPIVAELKAQFDDLNAVLVENGDDFEVIAGAIGNVLAYVVELVGSGLTDFLANLDVQQATEIAETFFDIVDNARTLVDVLSQTEMPVSFLDSVEFVADKLAEALETAVKLSAIVQAETARQRAESEAAGNVRRGAFGQVTGASFFGEDEATKAKVAAAGQEAYNESISKSLALIEASTQRKQENRDATDKLREAQDQNTDAAEAEADAFLKQRQAADEAAKQLEEYNQAQEKVAEAQEKLATDLQRELTEIDIETERKRLDILLEGQRKREDAAIENAQSLADIAEKNRQALEDAATDLSRNEQDISRKFANERLDLEREQAQQRVDIEKDTSRRITDIRSSFAVDLEDAERRRDAVAYLRLLRQQNAQIQDAVTDRNRQVEDAKITGERKREEQKIQQQRELEEARLTNQRKLEDLQTSLERELEAQSIAYSRELDTIATNEARKLEDLQTARQRDIEDAQRHYDEKLADLEQSLKAELDVIKKYNAEIEAEQQRHRSAMQEAVAKAGGPISQQASTITQRLSLDKVLEGIKEAQRKAGRTPMLGGRQAGGPVKSGLPYLVGEGGKPELFVPGTNGMIIPNRDLLMSLPFSSSAVNNINNSKAPVFNFPVNDAALFDNPIFVAKLRNVLLREMDKLV